MEQDHRPRGQGQDVPVDRGDQARGEDNPLPIREIDRIDRPRGWPPRSSRGGERSSGPSGRKPAPRRPSPANKAQVEPPQPPQRFLPVGPSPEAPPIIKPISKAQDPSGQLLDDLQAIPDRKPRMVFLAGRGRRPEPGRGRSGHSQSSAVKLRIKGRLNGTIKRLTGLRAFSGLIRTIDVERRQRHDRQKRREQDHQGNPWPVDDRIAKPLAERECPSAAARPGAADPRGRNRTGWMKPSGRLESPDPSVKPGWRLDSVARVRGRKATLSVVTKRTARRKAESASPDRTEPPIEDRPLFRIGRWMVVVVVVALNLAVGQRLAAFDETIADGRPADRDRASRTNSGPGPSGRSSISSRRSWRGCWAGTRDGWSSGSMNGCRKGGIQDTPSR